MSKNGINRVTNAVGGVIEKIEKAADALVTNLNNEADETMSKFGKVETGIIGGLKAANAKLDELLYGDNGAPDEEVEDEFASFPARATEAAAAGQAIDPNKLK